jgi:hypothetical protein
MFPRISRVWCLLGILILVLVLLPVEATVHASEPGELLLDRQGPINASQTLTDQQIYSFSGQANIRLELTGGSGDETVTATVKNAGGTAIKTITVRRGEVLWNTVALPENARISLKNNSASNLNYKLAVYAVAVVPSFAQATDTWSGTSKHNGEQSVITLNVPSDGLYKFTLAASSGAYQLVADNEYIRKTVKAGSLPNANDTVYYLKAGAHSLRIVQDPAAGVSTAWSVKIASQGGTDTLPNSESSAVLGGGSFFNTEWIPIFLPQDAVVDVRIAVTGGATDSLTLGVLNGGTRVFTSTSVLGGEVAWASTTLKQGANALNIVAKSGNAAPVSYTVELRVVPNAPFAWSGKTRGDTNRGNKGSSNIRMTFPESGLYTFTMAANSGRYQFLLGSNYIQKTVTDTNSTALSAYVAAGTYTLQVVQDPQQAMTDWKVDIKAGSAKSDALPFSRKGSSLGSADGSAFNQEWLPLQSSRGLPVNLQIKVFGATSESMRIDFYNGDKAVYTAEKVYGGETFWAPSTIISGTNRIRVIATGQKMSYEVGVLSVANAPSTWNGVAMKNGINPTALLNAPVAGVYDVVLTLQEGEGNLKVGGATGTASVSDASIAANVVSVRVELEAGQHTFTLVQDPNHARTVWSMSVKLRRENASTVYLPTVRK